MTTTQFWVANTTHYNTSKRNEEENNQYEAIIDRIQFTMAVLGFMGNVIVYITLSKNGYIFTSPTILRLLKNQSVADSIVCLLGSIFVMQPSMWTVSNEKLSSFICMVCDCFRHPCFCGVKQHAMCKVHSHLRFIKVNFCWTFQSMQIANSKLECTCLVGNSFHKIFSIKNINILKPQRSIISFIFFSFGMDSLSIGLLWWRPFTISWF